MVKLNRRSPLSIHLQLRAQLAHLIEVGHWTPGTQLPTVRQVADRLRINRNTASRVFAELARDGYLSCERGRGTFVTRRRAADGGRPARELLLVVDEAIGRAKRLGFRPGEFGVALYARAHAATASRRARVLFVECDRRHLNHFSAELAEALPVRVTALRVKDLGRVLRGSRRVLRKHRVAITTLPHLREVLRFLSRTDLDVVGVPTAVRLETLTRLATVPQGTAVGVACRESRCPGTMKLSLLSAGLTHLRVVEIRGQTASRLRRMLRKVSIVVCERRVVRRIRALAPRRMEILVDDRRLDRGGLEMVRRRLAANRAVGRAP